MIHWFQWIVPVRWAAAVHGDLLCGTLSMLRDLHQRMFRLTRTVLPLLLALSGHVHAQDDKRATRLFVTIYEMRSSVAEVPARAATDWAALRDPYAGCATADEVAAAIEFLASRDASYVTGTLLLVDGGNHVVEDLAGR